MSESGPDAPQGANDESVTGGRRRPERPPVRALDPTVARRFPRSTCPTACS